MRGVSQNTEHYVQIFEVSRHTIKSLIIPLGLTLEQYFTEAILMWTAPQPAWNQTTVGTTQADIQTAVYQARNGSTNVLLRWNYTLLPSQSLLLTTFSIGDGSSQDDIGLVITPGPSGTPNNKFKERFNIYSTSQFSSLTINKLTEQESATFQCKLQVGGDVWAYNIRVEVTGNNRVLKCDVTDFFLKLWDLLRYSEST